MRPWLLRKHIKWRWKGTTKWEDFGKFTHCSMFECSILEDLISMYASKINEIKYYLLIQIYDKYLVHYIRGDLSVNMPVLAPKLWHYYWIIRIPTLLNNFSWRHLWYTGWGHEIFTFTHMFVNWVWTENSSLIHIFCILSNK